MTVPRKTVCNPIDLCVSQFGVHRQGDDAAAGSLIVWKIPGPISEITIGRREVHGKRILHA